MVLGELGASISSALRKVTSSPSVDETQMNEMVDEITNALIASDVEVALANGFRDAVRREVDFANLPATFNKRKVIQKAVFQHLTRLVDPGRKPFRPRKGKTSVIMFVGLQGAGKTTTITKVGYYYRRQNFKVGLVCADTFRAGAFAQLKQNAIKAKLPFYGSADETDPVKVARDGVAQFRAEKYEVILVDTSGRHKQEASLFEEMTQISAAVRPDDVVFVLDASIGQAARAQADAFKSAVTVGSVIITKMDGHAKGGGALSAVAATQSPIVFLGSGEHIEELDTFDAESYVKRLLGLGDIQGLAAQLKGVGLDHNNESMKRMERGQFSLRDMRAQFEGILKLGPMSKVMEMMPGMLSQLMPKGQEAEASKRFKVFLCIMDSMTGAELDDPLLFQKDSNRIMRVAYGSGQHPALVHQMLQQYFQMEKMVGKVADMQKMLGNQRSVLTPKSKQVVTNQLGSLLPKEMLDAVGGQGALQDLMQSMGGVEGIMNMMGGRGGLAGMLGGGAGRGRGAAPPGRGRRR
jgi:signal recognition particle subunit SRP54